MTIEFESMTIREHAWQRLRERVDPNITPNEVYELVRNAREVDWRETGRPMTENWISKNVIYGMTHDGQTVFVIQRSHRLPGHVKLVTVISDYLHRQRIKSQVERIKSAKITSHRSQKVEAKTKLSQKITKTREKIETEQLAVQLLIQIKEYTLFTGDCAPEGLAAKMARYIMTGKMALGNRDVFAEKIKEALLIYNGERISRTLSTPPKPASKNISKAVLLNSNGGDPEHRSLIAQYLNQLDEYKRRTGREFPNRFAGRIARYVEQENLTLADEGLTPEKIEEALAIWERGNICNRRNAMFSGATKSIEAMGWRLTKNRGTKTKWRTKLPAVCGKRIQYLPPALESRRSNRHESRR